MSKFFPGHFTSQNISSYDKIRIIALYVMTKNGISDENLNKLFTHAQINLRDQDMVRNLSYLGINVLTDVSTLFWYFYSLIVVIHSCA